jgi:hypothetical protein
MEVALNGNAFGAVAYRIVLTKAVDDTGADLMKPESSTSDFQKIDSKVAVKAKLKSPARSAVAIKQLSGEVELFCPSKDPAATVTVSSFRKQIGVPIQSDTLKAERIQLTVWTPEQYRALEKKRAAEAEKSAQAQSHSSFSESFGMAPNDFIFTINGAYQKLIGMEFHDRAGTSIPTRGWGTGYVQVGPQTERTLSYHFENRLPDSTKLVIFVATPQALTKRPFTLADVALP